MTRAELEQAARDRTWLVYSGVVRQHLVHLESRDVHYHEMVLVYSPGSFSPNVTPRDYAKLRVATAQELLLL